MFLLVPCPREHQSGTVSWAWEWFHVHVLFHFNDFEDMGRTQFCGCLGYTKNRPNTDLALLAFWKTHTHTQKSVYRPRWHCNLTVSLTKNWTLFEYISMLSLASNKRKNTKWVDPFFHLNFLLCHCNV